MVEHTDLGSDTEIDVTDETSIEALARTFIRSVDTHDLDALRDCFTADCSWRIEPEERTVSLDEIIAWHAEVFAALPDFRVTADVVVVQDDRMAMTWTCSGTHSGTWKGIEATGRATELRGATFARYRDGKIAEGAIYYDAMAVGRNLGVMPPLGSRAERAIVAAANARTTVAKRLRR